ncbi:MAG: histidine kinase [Akkermansiaceae bacterium]|nr:histidine kinase [Akkermansiaceae bacterium]
MKTLLPLGLLFTLLPLIGLAAEIGAPPSGGADHEGTLKAEPEPFAAEDRQAKADVEITPPPPNPISQLARFVSPKLVKLEQRINWLDRELATLAKPENFPQRYRIGHRGYLASEDAPDPQVVLDLGERMPIDDIFLIPCQRDRPEDPGIFPASFTLEVADRADFSDARIIHQQGRSTQEPAKIRLLHVQSRLSGRYVRLRVHLKYNENTIDLFGLAEIFVFSNGEPVSLNATVSANGSLENNAMWHPEALNDGRTSLGAWDHGKPATGKRGDAVIVQDPDEPTTWQLELPEHGGIDRIVLFPYQVPGAQHLSIFPDTLQVLSRDGGSDTMIQQWANPLPGANQLSPLVLALEGIQTRSIAIRAISPWSMGERHISALSEIEVWSEGRNLATGRPVTRLQGEERSEVHSLTDGYSSNKPIAPVRVWLSQLIKRSNIEQELNALREVHRKLSTRSELNVSWGAAVMLGMTFLIPVFIFERRRMRSKDHLDIIRKRIAADLHDDIGSNLGSISLIARTVRKDLARLNGPEQLDDDLGEVELIARESSLAMRDIVWLLEREQDSIGDLVHRMRETAGRLLRGTDFILECSSERTTSRLTLDAKRHLFLFYKEAIHNILKHSKASKVSINLWDEGDRIGLEIVDNGIGLPVDTDKKPVSIKKLEDRAAILSGELKVKSSSESGTHIRLLVKHAKLTTPSKSS